MMDPACEVNEKGSRGKNDGNEFVNVGRAITLFCVEPRFYIRYAIDGDVDGYFCPGSGGRTYPH